MNIIGYIETFSDKTFKEMPFNDVDALVLSTLSYPSFENLISDAFQDEQIPYKIKFLSKEDCNKLGKENTTLDHSKLLKVLAKSKRFKELEIVEDSTNFSKQEVTQFYAMSIILDSNTMFISFRGTDTRMAGWKEDCNMSFLSEDTPKVEICHFMSDFISKNICLNALKNYILLMVLDFIEKIF